MKKMTTSDFKTVGERMKWARVQAGLTQSQVATLLGVHRETIAQIESNSRTIKASELKSFANLFKVRSEWILDGDIVLCEDGEIQLIARKLSKLSSSDLNSILRAVQVMKKERGNA